MSWDEEWLFTTMRGMWILVSLHKSNYENIISALPFVPEDMSCPLGSSREVREEEGALPLNSPPSKPSLSAHDLHYVTRDVTRNNYSLLQMAPVR